MLDIAIAVALAVIAMVTMYLGVHLTLHPPTSPAKRRLYKTAFIACGIASVSLVGWQASRNASSGAVIAGRLTHIEHNTNEPPKVEVNVQPTPVVVQRASAPTEIAESPCVNPLPTSAFKQEKFRPRIDSDPDLLYGIRAEIPPSKILQGAINLRIWASGNITLLSSGEPQRINRRFVEVNTAAPSEDPFRINFASSDPIRIVCIDWQNIPPP